MNDYLATWDNTAFPGPVDPFSVPMSFRDFLRLKKEVLEAYRPYSEESLRCRQFKCFALDYQGLTEDRIAKEWEWASHTPVPIQPEWPEALKGLTQEDIEILKL